MVHDYKLPITGQDYNTHYGAGSKLLIMVHDYKLPIMGQDYKLPIMG